MLTDSPWAKIVSADSDISGMPGGGPGGLESEMGGPGGMPVLSFVVRWESAAPVRHACAKTEDAHGARLAELTQQYYVISVSSSLPRSGGRRVREGREASRPDALLAGLAESATLRLKGQDPLAPEKIEVLENAASLTTLFLFPRSNAISLSHREAVFETSLGPVAIKARFPIREMTWAGALAL